MMPQGNNVRSVLRVAALLGTAAFIGLTACTPTEVTEMHCVRVPAEQGVERSDETGETVVCSPRRVRLIIHDKYSEEEEVVSNKTW